MGQNLGGAVVSRLLSLTLAWFERGFKVCERKKAEKDCVYETREKWSWNYVHVKAVIAFK